MTRCLAVALAGVCLTGIATAAELEPPPEAVDVADVVKRAEAAMRGDRTYGTIGGLLQAATEGSFSSRGTMAQASAPSVEFTSLPRTRGPVF